MKTLIVGLHCSGKTTLAKALQEVHGGVIFDEMTIEDVLSSRTMIQKWPENQNLIVVVQECCIPKDDSLFNQIIYLPYTIDNND